MIAKPEKKKKEFRFFIQNETIFFLFSHFRLFFKFGKTMNLANEFTSKFHPSKKK